MRKKYIKQTLLLLLLLFYSFSEGQTLLHYWNFNSNASVSAITTPTQTNILGASLTANNSATSLIDFANGTAQNFDIQNLNTQNSDVSGTHLRFNNPIGGSLVFALPTTGYENIVVKFATRRSSTGAGNQLWSYSIDGTNYVSFATVVPNNGDPALATLDFSAITLAKNNPNFKLKVEFTQGTGGIAGNNRFDNFTAKGTLIVAADSTAPVATFFPTTATANVASTVNPTISFNENIRLLNNDVITNTNVDALVEVRLNNASGSVILFDATFTANKITIVPTVTLTSNQLYYVALLPNTIEDESNNALTTLQTTAFTTSKPTVSLSVSSNTGSETGTTAITITAISDNAVNGNQTVDLGITGTNITSGDYSVSNSVITILNGQTTGSVTFTVLDDVLVEGSEIATFAITNPSTGIAITTSNVQTVTIADNDTALNIDLSTYVRVGRYNLPEPTRTTAPANSLLAQEVSAVTYNWDTNTLFVVGDGSTSIVQVSKTGQLIDSMTLAQGSSPQGTEFYDTEGLTYIGNGQFVMTEERDRQVVKFTYVAGSTLTRSATQTVKLGTFVNNIGTEGLSYDPLTNGYVVLKEISPIGIFQTGIDFAAGTATNGSATTENSVNLFDPALLGVSDVADVFALSNIPSLNGQPLYNNLLVLSQENAKVVNSNRSGVVANSLTIVSDAGNPLDVASQQHEGLTMDRDGILYITSENGGGDIDHPQLWVYAPSTIPNQAPTVVALTNTTTSVLENSNTTAAVKVADIAVTDDGLGTNNITLSGADANFFQITGSSLYIKAGTVLDYETKTSYNVTVNVDDTTVGNTPDASVNFVLAVTDVAVETTAAVSVSISEVASWSSSNSLVAADWFEVTNTGTTTLDITGWKIDDNSNTFTAALALSGITSIAAGESVIFLETGATNSATIIANFKSAWFGTNVPSGLQVGYYTGSGAGLSSSGDAVNLYDASGVLKANVVFGVATTNKTFNNALGLTNSTITTLSQVGVNDAFAAVNDTNQIGSPGTVGKLFISEIAPWSSNSSPVGADWFEVTNTKAVAVDITGWKIDDNSQSPAAAVALNGITSINPGESVIFIETNDLAGKTTAFLNNWFGTNPSSGIRIGNYTGSGVGLSSSGDQVNLYNATSATPQASVLFGASPTTTFATFDNAAGLTTITTAITQASAIGTKGAFIAANSISEIGSPGSIVTAPCPTITVTVTPAALSVCAGATTTVTVIATGGTLPYTVSGSPFTVGGGTFNYTVTDAKGCTATKSVTIIENPITDSVTAITACDSYTWNGTTYTMSGTYTGTTANCVTEKLHLTITSSSINTSVITACDSYTWNGTTYTTSGMYTGTTTNCVTEKLNLTITSSSINTSVITACNSYTWNGTTYMTSGMYTGTTINCVTEKLNLTIIPATNAGTSGTLSVEIGKTPTDAQLFAALTGADSGGTWSHSGLVYTYTLSGISPCTVASSTVTVTNTIPTAWSLCYGAKVADAVGATTLKFYSAITGGSALALTTNLAAKTYYATQIVNGLESTPRVPVTITINSLPIAVATVTTSDSVLCKYIGTTNTITYTATLGASSYIWTVPTGVSIVSGQGTNTLVVDFHNATTLIGSIGVKAVNASGCTSASAKSIALSTRLPVAPSVVKLTYNGVAKVRVGNFIGDATKTLVLTATDISGTANHYTWDLPVGVAVVSGDKNYDNTIAINLGGVAAGNTDLVFKAYSIAGCGTSIARTLTVKRNLPSAPLALALTDDSISSVTKITNVSAYTGKLKTTPLTLTATPSTVSGYEPTSYKWIVPSSVTVVDAGAVFVSETSGFKTYTSTSKAIHINLTAIGTATSLLIQVYGVNGNGTSLLARNLTLTSSIPSRPGALTTLSGGLVTYNPTCTTLAVKVPNVLGVTYTWSVVGGALATIVTSNSDGNEVIINVSQLPSAPLSYFTINVKASNGTGSSSASAYTIRLGNPCGTVARQITEEKPVIALDEFTAIAYPNPFATVFTIEFTALATEQTAILVYDMAGRLVEQVQVATNTVVLGLNYPAGVYNVIVNQGGKTKTLRVIKK
ncbi:SdiA-regulated domain-containing protein [Flavobacterium restrictum]|uniref:T9SS type A sorting domain-containing protein n=1 Tax=Flavobacterium restrictum TaxID=2594428 RepID=A0A553E561_9FLAO|nr:SdiA-regulated domain-containing protein [Flavobacterium restrictum]TRX40149.1 T9SS type A sorting domain-containing protein [Flavobacterium restrictum]